MRIFREGVAEGCEGCEGCEGSVVTGVRGSSVVIETLLSETKSSNFSSLSRTEREKKLVITCTNSIQYKCIKSYYIRRAEISNFGQMHGL